MLKASDQQQHITEVNTNKIHTLHGIVLHTEQILDITCEK